MLRVGESFYNAETFGQLPLQVRGYGDIHESLEADMAKGRIESVSGDETGQSGLEQWFTRLPPVLTFELSRFQYNRHTTRSEKIHNRLEFPEMLYLDRYVYYATKPHDTFLCLHRSTQPNVELTATIIINLTVMACSRYLECNKCSTRQKRLEVKKIKAQLNVLKAKLDK